MISLAARLRSHVEILCRSERNTGRCPEGLREAAVQIEHWFAEAGYRTSRQEFPADGILCANIEAIAPGFVGNDRPHLILGAHYDSAEGTPGADDNASAVAVLVETARLLREDPAGARLRFVAYANEEPMHFLGPTMGSRVHARACRAAGDQIRGMICLESLGVFTDEPDSQHLPMIRFLPDELLRHCEERGVDPTVGNFLAMIGDRPSRELLAAFDSAFPRDAGLPVIATDALGEVLRLSDHLSYWDEGFRALMLTDTAMCRNVFYHRAGDTPEKLNYDVMALVTERLVTTLRKVAGED